MLILCQENPAYLYSFNGSCNAVQCQSFTRSIIPKVTTSNLNIMQKFNLLQVPPPITDTVLVQCVNTPMDISTQATISNKTKKNSEKLKCEPDVFIKIERVLGSTNCNRIANTNSNTERPSESDSESDTGSESEVMSLPDGEMQDSNTMTGEIVPNGLHSDSV